LTLRGGANLANNPVPDDTVNPLFPAIVKNHFTFGAGYAFSNVSEVNASFVYAPNVSVATPSGVTIEHSQTNWQLMYSHRF
jgi:long-chain fatty acid transport protein